jgi:pimeloyl-ACP methyl ester carboxylesterase
MPARAALVALAVLAAMVAAPAPARAAADFVPCEPVGFECGSLTVPLDRTGAVGGSVTLRAERLRAATNPTRTAVVGLAGGPGQAALPLAGEFAEITATALQTRDLLVFDQRGTGRSGPLRCAALDSAGPDSSTAVARSCARQLGRARAFFRTADSVDDLEDLRREADYEKLVLVGVSYGTKVALDYAARHPDRVESMVLDSVVPPEGWDPLMRPTFAAIPRVLRGLCTAGACRRVTADPVGDVRRLVRRAARRALSGTVTSAGGRRLRVPLTPLGLFDILLGGDENPTLRADLPGAVRSALRGDLRPILRLRLRAAGLSGVPSARLQVLDPETQSDALYTATLCEESSFPWARAAGTRARLRAAETAVARLPHATLGPFIPEVALLGGPLRTCLGWPNAAPPPPPPGPLPAAPALLLAGRDDLRTPLEGALAVGSRIPGSRVVPVPFTGHSALGSDVGSCTANAVAAFFAGRPVDPCSGRRVFSTTPIAPTRLSAVPGRTRAARTLEALRGTVRDVLRQFVGDALAAGRRPPTGSRVAGLRGGAARWSSTGIRFAGVQYVPGVAVTGFLPHAEGAQATFGISGSAAARGRVTVGAGGRVTGRLGGRRIDGRLAAATTAAARAAVRRLD